MKAYRALCVVVVLALVALPAIVFADNAVSLPNVILPGDTIEPPTFVVSYDSPTPIQDAIDGKVIDALSLQGRKLDNTLKFEPDKGLILEPIITQDDIAASGVDTIKAQGEIVKDTVADVQYPYVFTSTINGIDTIIIDKARYDEGTHTMWYWIHATRNGQSVYTDNPYWAYPALKDVIENAAYDKENNQIILTTREDPKGAIENLLSIDVSRNPLGPTTETSE